MNILIPHSWLKEYLDTKADPNQIAKCLSLSGPSVEKIIKTNNDFVYDLEITTNRVDCMSVYGLAREAAAILPQFGIKAQLKSLNLKPEKPENDLNIIIQDPDHVCHRVLGAILDQVNLKPSEAKIKQRLEMVGIRSLNNVIDITNYVMTEIGHPTHVFDYDRIPTKKLILRKSKKGEEIISLEDKKYALDGGDIVIDDGTGKIIDLPGIIGTSNSIVNDKTKRVLFFIETNDSTQIRKTSMGLGIRTVAATLNEKGVDPELAKTALLRGIQLFKQLANARQASQIYDLYPHPEKLKTVKVSLQLIKQRLGADISFQQVDKILLSLGFKTKTNKIRNDFIFNVNPPSWRNNDINIPEDIVEEVARLYGYHNLPSILPPLLSVPEEPDNYFIWEEKTKDILKGLGFCELYTYSMQSISDLEKFNLDPNQHLKLLNPLSEDWVYMRTNLLPSILNVFEQNKGRNYNLKVFELSHVYLPRKNNLPLEKQMLALALNKKSFFEVKGYVEALLNQLGIKKIEFLTIKDIKNCWHQLKSAKIMLDNQVLGYIGEIKHKLLQNFNIEDNIIIAYLDFDILSQFSSNKKTYIPIAKYPPIIEDLSFKINKNIYTADLIKAIKNSDKLISKVQLVDIYKNGKTFRLIYQAKNKSLSGKQIVNIRKKVVSNLEKLGAELKGSLK